MEDNKNSEKGIDLNVEMFDSNDQLITTVVGIKQKKKDETGKELDEYETVDKEYPWLMKDAIIGCLLNPVKGDENIEGKDKMDLYHLYMKVKKAGKGKVDLSIDELAVIKKRIGLRYPPLTVGQLYEYLEANK